jgi:hypothetical protein
MPTGALSLPGPDFRVLSWNLHKNDDPGWEADLALRRGQRLVADQESALTAGLNACCRMPATTGCSAARSC